MRRVGVCSLLVFATACSGGDDAEPLVTAQATATIAAGADDGGGGGDVDGAADSAPAAASETGTSGEASIAASVTLTGELSAELVVAMDASDDPFGTFASCSGWRSVVGAYSVLVSSPGGVVSSFSLLTTEPIDGPGIHDADVRIERPSEDPIDATGTVTLDAGLGAGSFTAFALDGTPVEGEFTCAASPGSSPELLGLGRDDEVLETVEVFALVRDGVAERVLELAVTAETAPTAECPGAIGLLDAPVLVRVDGDETLGAITTFELTGGEPAAMRLRAGTTVYEFDDVEVELDDTTTSGIFVASDDTGVTIDGAFRCT